MITKEQIVEVLDKYRQLSKDENRNYGRSITNSGRYIHLARVLCYDEIIADLLQLIAKDKEDGK